MGLFVSCARSCRGCPLYGMSSSERFHCIAVFLRYFFSPCMDLIVIKLRIIRCLHFKYPLIFLQIFDELLGE